MLLAALGVVAAERDRLLAYPATGVLLLALLRVVQNFAHLLAARQAAVGVPALARVHQGLDAPLDRLLAVLGCGKKKRWSKGGLRQRLEETFY